MKTTLAEVWGYPVSFTQILHLWNNIFRVNLIRLSQRLQKEPKKGLMMIIQMCNCHTIGIQTPTTIIIKSSLLVVWTCDSEISLFHISWDICIILATFLTSKWWDINSQAAVSENAFCAFCFPLVVCSDEWFIQAQEQWNSIAMTSEMVQTEGKKFHSLPPSLTRSTNCVYSIRTRQRMGSFSRVPDAGGDWPERKLWMNLVLFPLLLFLMPFPLACTLSEV